MNPILSKINILYVEDQKDVLNELSSILQATFNEVHIVSSGKDGYELYKKLFSSGHKVDIIISNINIPDMNGIEMFEKIKQMHQEALCIFVSSRTESEYLLKAIDLGVEAYMVKPIKSDEFIAKVEEVAHREYFKKQIEFKREERKNYIKALDNIAMVYTMKRDGKITSINDFFKNFTGYNNEDIKDLYFYNFIHPEIASSTIDKVWETLDLGKIWTGDTKFLNKEKEAFYLKISVFKVSDFNRDEYITIGFSTTQENLKRREFHKNVLQKIKEYNSIIYKNKKKITELESINKRYELTLERVSGSIEELKAKNASKERQLNHYEKQMLNVDDKGFNALKKKSEALEEVMLLNKTIKLESEKVLEENKKLKSEAEIWNKENIRLDKLCHNKTKRIHDLEDVISNMEEEYGIELNIKPEEDSGSGIHKKDEEYNI